MVLASRSKPGQCLYQCYFSMFWILLEMWIAIMDGQTLDLNLRNGSNNFEKLSLEGKILFSKFIISFVGNWCIGFIIYVSNLRCLNQTLGHYWLCTWTSGWYNKEVQRKQFPYWQLQNSCRGWNSTLCWGNVSALITNFNIINFRKTLQMYLTSKHAVIWGLYN